MGLHSRNGLHRATPYRANGHLLTGRHGTRPTLQIPRLVTSYNYHTARDLGRHHRDGIQFGDSCVFVTCGSH